MKTPSLLAVLGLMMVAVSGCIIIDDDDCNGFGECQSGDTGGGVFGAGGSGGAAGGAGGEGGLGGTTPGCDSSAVLCPCAEDGACEEGLACIEGNCAVPCNFDFECQSQEVCAAGQCVLACGPEAACPAGYDCVGTACLPDPDSFECEQGADCATGYCVNGDCTSPCALNTDCPAGELCEISSGTCVDDTSPTPSCSDEQPCAGDGQNCLEGVCRYGCESLEACKLIDGRFDACDAGVCKTQEEVAPQCTFSEPCASGALCISNVCIE